MMRLHAVVALFDDLDAAELTAWIERRWVRLAQDDGAFAFQEIDIARVRLIHDLRRGMAVPEETLPLVLSLLDQVHALRGVLSDVARALETQPPDVRDAVLGRRSERRS